MVGGAETKVHACELEAEAAAVHGDHQGNATHADTTLKYLKKKT